MKRVKLSRAVRSAAPLIFSKRALVLALAGTLGACGGGGGGSDSVTSAPSTIGVSGSVGDGPVVQAQVSVLDSKGRLVATTQSGANSRFHVTLPADTKFPITLLSTGGTDLVSGAEPGMTMMAVNSDANMADTHITPFSTLIAKTAENSPGGVTRNNLARAAERVTAQLNFGFDQTLVADPVHSNLGEPATASMLKASEGLGEMIRRVRATLQVIGVDMSEDDLAGVISGDLIDGALDGIGSGANARVAAVANVVSAAVLVEALGNQLRVGDTVATQRMDGALRTVQPNGATTMAQVPVSAAMLDQTYAALEAVRAFSPDPEIIALQDEVNQLRQSRATATSVRLSATNNSVFTRILNSVVTAGEGNLEHINAVMRGHYKKDTISDGDTSPTDPGTGDTTTPTDPGTGDTTTPTDPGTGDTTTPTDPGTGDTTTPTDPGTGGSTDPISGTTTPMAFQDSAQTTVGAAVTINVLANDLGLADTPITVTIAGAPSHGTAQVNSTGAVLYTPAAGFSGSDSFTYRVTDRDGDASLASVSVSINGGTPIPVDRTVTLTWTPPTTGPVDGYYVYFGTSSGATSTRISNLPLSQGSFAPETPTVSYSSTNDLSLAAGAQACFKVTAYNSVGESVPSETVCGNI